MKHSRLVLIFGCLLLASSLAAGAQTACEASSPLLGAGRGCAVFQLGATKVSMSHGDPTGVDGDLCMASGSTLSMSGGQIITGTAYLEPGVKYPDDILERAGAVDFAADLTAEIMAANDAAAALAAFPCDVSVSELKVSSSSMMDVRDLVPGGGRAVVCVSGNMEVKGSGTSFLLSGQPGDSFVFNVGGSFKINGAKIFTVDGLTPSDVVYNVLGSGSDVAFSGGGGGLGCCKAAIEGSILAPQRKIALSPGKVTGQVISARDIALASGSLVVCEPGVDEPRGSIGDRVWLDNPGLQDGTVGVQDPGETGINGVVVKLLDGSGHLVASMTTSGDGNYLFTDLPAGTYSVMLQPGVALDGLAPTYDLDGLATPGMATLSLAAGEVNLAVDFGYEPTR